MTEKFRPNFLNPDIKVGPLAGDKYGHGRFVDVGNLENLSKDIKEKAPSGYVVKQYKSSDDSTSMAETLFLEGSKELKGISVAGMARELKRRNSLMRKYFADFLPELVVPTQVIIGRDERTNKKNIYEIQPRLDKASTANFATDDSFMEPIYRYYHFGLKDEKSRADELLNNFIAYIKNTFPPETIDKFKQELPIFVKKIELIENCVGLKIRFCGILQLKH